MSKPSASGPVVPDLILSGVGLAPRATLAGFLAFLEGESIFSIARDGLAKLSDQGQALLRNQPPQVIDRLSQRLHLRATQIEQSTLDDDALRLAVWIHLRETFALPPALSFSFQGARRISQDLAAQVAPALGSTFAAQQAKSGLADRLNGFVRQAFKSSDPLVEFSTVIERFALLQIRALLESTDPATEPGRKSLREALLAELHDPSAFFDDSETAEAERQAAIRDLLAGGSLRDLSLSIGLAGFAPYILAAQASAVLPLTGGKVAAGLLALLANPALALPVAGLALWWAHDSSQSALLRSYTAAVAASLCLSGLGDAAAGTRRMLQTFERVPDLLAVDITSSRRLESARADYLEHFRDLSAVRPPTETTDDASGRDFEPDGADASADRATTVSDLVRANRFGRALSALTFGDLVEHVAHLDPALIAAADAVPNAPLETALDFVRFVAAAQANASAAIDPQSSGLTAFAHSLVAAQLIADGHRVEHDADSMALRVDGSALRVACAEDPAQLQAILDQYPDQAVLANAELLGSPSDAADAPRRFFLHGYSRQAVADLAEDAGSASPSDALSDAVNRQARTLLLSVAIARSPGALWPQQLAPEAVFWAATVDRSGKRRAPVRGGFSGSAAGLLLFGPAGASIDGPRGGIEGSAALRRMKRSLDAVVDPEGEKQLETAARALLQASSRVLVERIDGLGTRQQQLGSGGLSRCARVRLADQQQADRELRAAIDALLIRAVHLPESTPLANRCLTLVLQSHVHPLRLQPELRDFSIAFARLEHAVENKAQQVAEETVNAVSDAAQKASDAIRKAAPQVAQSARVAGERVAQAMNDLFRSKPPESASENPQDDRHDDSAR